METVITHNTAALVGIPARATGAGPGYRKLALPGLKSVHFFCVKVIFLGYHVFSQLENFSLIISDLDENLCLKVRFFCKCSIIEQPYY